MSLFVVPVLALLYFLPTIIAAQRENSNTVGIFAMNLLWGWTFVGWVIALVWALSRQSVDKPAPEPLPRLRRRLGFVLTAENTVSPTRASALSVAWPSKTCLTSVEKNQRGCPRIRDREPGRGLTLACGSVLRRGRGAPALGRPPGAGAFTFPSEKAASDGVGRGAQITTERPHTGHRSPKRAGLFLLQSDRRRLSRSVPAVAVVLAIAGGLAWLSARRATGVTLSADNTIVIANLTDATGDRVFDEASSLQLKHPRYTRSLSPPNNAVSWVLASVALSTNQQREECRRRNNSKHWCGYQTSPCASLGRGQRRATLAVARRAPCGDTRSSRTSSWRRDDT